MFVRESEKGIFYPLIIEKSGCGNNHLIDKEEGNPKRDENEDLLCSLVLWRFSIWSIASLVYVFSQGIQSEFVEMNFQNYYAREKENKSILSHANQ